MSIRRDPFERMERMIEQMRRSMAGWEPADIALPGPMGFGFDRSDINLSVEPDDDGVVVLADLPGYEREDIELRFDDGVLSIRADHETSEEDELAVRHRSRHVYEEVAIPGSVLRDEISASYRNGVLEVHLPTEGDVDDGTVIDIE